MPSTPAFPRFGTRERSYSVSLLPSSDDISENISDDDHRNEDEVEHVTWLTSDIPRRWTITAPPVTVESANTGQMVYDAERRRQKCTAFPQEQLHTTPSHHASGRDVTASSGRSRLPTRYLSRGELNSYEGTPARSRTVAFKTVDDTRELMIYSDDIEEESDQSLGIKRKGENDNDSEGSQVNVLGPAAKQSSAAPNWRPNRRTMNLKSKEDSDAIETISSQEDTVSTRPSKVRIIDDIETQIPSLPAAGRDPIEDPSQVLDTQLRETPAVIRYSRAGVIDLDLISSSVPHSIVGGEAEEELEDLQTETPFKTPKPVWPRFIPLTPSSSAKTKLFVTGSQIAKRIQQNPYYDMSSTPPFSTLKPGYSQTPTASKTVQQNKSQSKYTTGIAGLVASWVLKVHSDVQLNSLAGTVSPSVGISKRRADNMDAVKSAGIKMRRGVRTYEFWKVLLNNKGYSYGSKNYAGFTLVHLQRCERRQEYSSDDDFGIQSPAGDGEKAWAFLFDATNVSSLVATNAGPSDMSLTTVMLSDMRLSRGTILRLYKPVWRVQLTDQDMDAFYKAGYDSYSDKGALLVCINWQIME
ncbi:hypothetical protein V1520DRAFT_331842 [Lipomyces starkeyi]|uniref:Uncharacterized protein n=1 Tax=Lipomyces starkeyi NRRL Y-11557 TaxID=675824 RepID=A0A1E3Q372_LIPST|nr:hypothetical protein LIPSTDRAFT_105629 [Lipomyces starkeyi NRRL Y-11557]